jgi:hypothetical protein
MSIGMNGFSASPDSRSVQRTVPTEWHLTKEFVAEAKPYAPTAHYGFVNHLVPTAILLAGDNTSQIQFIPLSTQIGFIIGATGTVARITASMTANPAHLLIAGGGSVTSCQACPFQKARSARTTGMRPESVTS